MVWDKIATALLNLHSIRTLVSTILNIRTVLINMSRQILQNLLLKFQLLCHNKTTVLKLDKNLNTTRSITTLLSRTKVSLNPN
jgi:hypothetical protein